MFGNGRDDFDDDELTVTATTMIIMRTMTATRMINMTIAILKIMMIMMV